MLPSLSKSYIRFASRITERLKNLGFGHGLISLPVSSCSLHYVKSVQIQSFSGPNKENTDQKNLRIWKLFTQCQIYLLFCKYILLIKFYWYFAVRYINLTYTDNLTTVSVISKRYVDLHRIAVLQ